MLLVKVAFLVVLLQFGLALSYFEGENDDIIGDIASKKSYQSLVKKLNRFLEHDFNVEHLLKQLSSNNSNTTNKCSKQFVSMNKTQLIPVVDASFKPNPGILTGNLNWMGNYRECMQTDGLHYCTMANVALNIGRYVPVTLGLCVPEQCHSKDVTNFFILLGNSYMYVKLYSNDCEIHTIPVFRSSTNLSSDKNKAVTRYGNTSFINVYDNAQAMKQFGSDGVCYKKETSYSNGAVVMIIISFLIAAVCIMGTLTECLKGSCVRKNTYKILVEPTSDRLAENEVMSNNESQIVDEKKPHDISMHGVTVSEKDSFTVNFLLCFSVIKNTKAILNTDVPKGSITAINGMRTLSITWVVLGHVLAFAIQFVDDLSEVFTWVKWFSFSAILNATVSVDSFFFLSGLLVSYLSMKRFNTKGSLPLVRYYLHRYIRLTPSYAYLLFFFTYLYPILGSGPNWFSSGPHSPQMENCISYWWTNLLYINTLYPTKQDDMCFGWSWYLADDMIYYVISPIILFAMYKLRWIGVTLVNGVLIVACCIINGVLIYHYNASPVFYADNMAVMAKPNNPSVQYQQYIYFKPYTRISPYLVGLILGYIISNKISINGIHRKYIYLAGWVVAFGLGFAVVYGPYSQSQYTWKMVDWIIYGVTFRLVWAIALAWVIFACHNGWGGYIDKFLSWRVFIPLSRLTYGVYLIHPIILFLYYASAKAIIDMSIFQLIIIFLASTVLSFLGSFVTSVCIEYPVFNLEKLITSRKKTS